jgi:2-(1,2-epoxy-1,2-dihydrophenyl)acetyl-CoA isomerase
MPPSETVLVRREGAAVTIVLNRPEALNAWNIRLGEELLQAVRDAASDPAVRAVALTGAGRAFSSGADLRDVVAMEQRTDDGHPDVGGMLAECYHPIITAIREMPKPVLSIVNGPAAGIGASLALAADLIVAGESAYFLLAFVNIGLVPDGGSSLYIPARAGFTRAAEMALLGERVSATDAERWNLINRVVPDDELRPALEELATRFAEGPTRSFAGTKRQLNNWLFTKMEDQLELEADIQQEMAATGDFVEGVTAFVEKRGARFSGA